jgi:coatomer protein complex subunit epsilon
MDRLDLARNEVASVKTWAEDALLLQMMEAWVDLRVVSFKVGCSKPIC